LTQEEDGNGQAPDWADRLKHRVMGLSVERCSAVYLNLIRDEDGIYWLIVQNNGRLERLGK